MAVTVEMYHTGDSVMRSEVIAVLEHVFVESVRRLAGVDCRVSGE